MMRNQFLRSFVQPFSINVEPFDLVFNEHFANDVTLRKLDVLDNGYLMGFMTALLTLMTNQTFGKASEPYQINDIWLGILDDDDGVKTISHVSNLENDRTMILIQNFFFKANVVDVDGRGLSKNERQHFASVFHWSYEERIVEYLVYDMNSDTVLQTRCENQSNRIVQPYMERIRNFEESDRKSVEEVKSFIKLTPLLSSNPEMVSRLEDNLNEEGIEKILCNIRKLDAMNHKSEPFVYGFTHGLVLMTAKIGLKVRVSGEESQSIRFSIQSVSTPEVIPLFGQPKAQEHSQLLILGIINILGNTVSQSVTLEAVLLHVSTEISSITKSHRKYENSDFIRFYILGMAHENLKVYDAHLPTDGETRAIVIESFNRANVPLIVFNFDPNAEISIHGLNLGGFFLNRHHRQEAFIISITESDPSCNGALSSKYPNYHIDITPLKQTEHIKGYPVKYEKIGSTLLQQIIDDYSIYALEHLYTNIEKLLLQQARKIGADDQSVLYFLEGFFYNTIFYESYHAQRGIRIDKFLSRTAYSVRLRFANLTTHINFFNALFVGRHDANRAPNSNLPEAYEYRIADFLYQYNQTNSTVFMCSNGTTYLAKRKQRVYSESSMYDPDIKTMIRGKKCRIVNQEDATYKLLPEFYRTFFGPDGMLQQIVNTKRNLEFGTYIVDDLQNVYQLSTDLLSAAVMAQGVYSIREEYVENKGNKMKRSTSTGHKSTNTKLSTAAKVKYMKPSVVKTAAQGFRKVSSFMSHTFLKSSLLPGVGLVLSTVDLVNALKNLRNGDTSPAAIFDVTAAALSLVLGVVDLVLPGSGTALKYVAFVISSLLYAASNTKKVIGELKRVSRVVEIRAWRKPFEFFSILFTGSVSKWLHKAERDKDWNEQMMKNALQMMTSNPHIHGFITSAGCYENGRHGPCSSIYVDMVKPVPLIPSQQTKSDPSIPINFDYSFIKTCHMYALDPFWMENYMKGQTTMEDFKTNVGQNMPYDAREDQTYRCNDAFGIRRKQVSNKPNDITIYSLNGNSIVFASNDTNNVFELSGGKFCRIEGGTKQNVFKFGSFFQRCTILGSNRGLNTLDISNMEYKFETLLIGNETDAIFLDSHRLEIGRIFMKNMNNFIVNSQEVNNLIVDCKQQVRGVEGKETTDCEEPLYNIVLANTDCDHDLHIESYGCVRINSRAVKNGRITYTFDGLNGNSKVLIQHSPGLTHKIVMTSFDVHEFDLSIWNYSDHTTLMFNRDDKSLVVKIFGRSDSVELLLGGGVQMGIELGVFKADIYFPQSKGQLWYKYRKIFASMNFMINAYAHRDREAFILENGLIRFGKKQFHFHPHVANGTEKIRCKSGYNLVVIEPVCAPLWKIFMNKLNWFHDIEVIAKSKIQKLTIDLTLLCDVMNQWYKYYSLSVQSVLDNQNVYLTVYVVVETEMETIEYKVGVIRLIGIMLEKKYEKVIITSTSDFILILHQERMIRTKPLTKIIESLSPVMLIDPSLTEKAQMFLFRGRSLINYDLVLYQNSSLIITNLASDVFKTFTLSNPSPYFYTVVIKNYTDEKMRTLKLEFEDGLKFDLMKFNTNQAISFTDFIRKLQVCTQYIGGKMSLMNYDNAFKSAIEKMPTNSMGGTCFPMEV